MKIALLIILSVFTPLTTAGLIVGTDAGSNIISLVKVLVPSPTATTGPDAQQCSGSSETAFAFGQPTR